jgi:hypothetical protein
MIAYSIPGPARTFKSAKMVSRGMPLSCWAEVDWVLLAGVKVGIASGVEAATGASANGGAAWGAKLAVGVRVGRRVRITGRWDADLEFVSKKVQAQVARTTRIAVKKERQ